MNVAAKALLVPPSLLALAAAESALRVFPLKNVLGWKGLRLPRAVAGALSRGIRGVDERSPFWKPSCLRRSVAMRLLRGPETKIAIGVRRTPDGALAAHAWTEDGDAEGFTELATL